MILGTSNQLIAGTFPHTLKSLRNSMYFTFANFVLSPLDQSLLYPDIDRNAILDIPLEMKFIEMVHFPFLNWMGGNNVTIAEIYA